MRTSGKSDRRRKKRSEIQNHKRKSVSKNVPLEIGGRDVGLTSVFCAFTMLGRINQGHFPLVHTKQILQTRGKENFGSLATVDRCFYPTIRHTITRSVRVTRAREVGCQRLSAGAGGARSILCDHNHFLCPLTSLFHSSPAQQVTSSSHSFYSSLDSIMTQGIQLPSIHEAFVVTSA